MKTDYGIIRHMRLTPRELISFVQDHTGVPWLNGEAYAGYVGYRALAGNVIAATDRLAELQEAARARQDYATADAIRQIIAEIRPQALLLSGAKTTKP